MTPKGCHLIDVAPSPSLNVKVSAFLRAEAFETSPAYARKQEQLLVESGLFDESVETLIEMRVAMNEFRNWQAKKDSDKAKAKHAGLRAPPLERNED
jgi:hypothetical protein